MFMLFIHLCIVAWNGMNMIWYVWFLFNDGNFSVGSSERFSRAAERSTAAASETVERIEHQKTTRKGDNNIYYSASCEPFLVFGSPSAEFCLKIKLEFIDFSAYLKQEFEKNNLVREHKYKNAHIHVKNLY